MRLAVQLPAAAGLTGLAGHLVGGEPASARAAVPSGTRLIASTPQAIPTPIASAAMSPATRCAACCAEPHWASSVRQPASYGSPAWSQAVLVTLLDCSPAWVTQPPATCSTAVGAIPARSSRAIWMPPSSAPDEIVRWATPITVFQRTTTRDTVLGGQEIRAGQRVGLFYRSANFDEEVFDHPERFDVLRSPNPHLGYGGLGTHYCLGASPAKLEIELIFNAIADAMPDIAKAGDPVRLRSGWINGIKSLPVTYRP